MKFLVNKNWNCILSLDSIPSGPRRQTPPAGALVFDAMSTYISHSDAGSVIAGCSSGEGTESVMLNSGMKSTRVCALMALLG